MALISLSQYGTRVGVEFDESSPGTVEEQISAYIEDASNLVQLIAFGNDTDSYWDDVDESGDNPMPEALVPVIVNMVQRRADNPRGLTGEQLGDYQWQAAQGSATGIYATRTERKLIRKAAGKLGVGTLHLEGYLPLQNVEFAEDDLTENL